MANMAAAPGQDTASESDPALVTKASDAEAAALARRKAARLRRVNQKLLSKAGSARAAGDAGDGGFPGLVSLVSSAATGSGGDSPVLTNVMQGDVA
jgi:hypothetical protein